MDSIGGGQNLVTRIYPSQPLQMLRNRHKNTLVCLSEVIWQFIIYQLFLEILECIMQLPGLFGNSPSIVWCQNEQWCQLRQY